ncbi:MAG: DNA repair protein RecN [Deltaproteobacteria bacterium]|nr:DNA repair protein RecN [Deltaproteobacteria bacterium]
MLKHLAIKDFAIIDKLELDFSPGMTVLTGETGAGKSIIIDALHLVLGGRAVTDVIRTGSDTAEVTATFSVDGAVRERTGQRLKEQDIAVDDGELLIRRIVSRSGRNKIYVNGTLVTAAVLQAITSGLVDITGQHEHVWLLEPDTQLELLDAFASLGALRTEVASQYGLTREIYDELRRLKLGEQETLAREDFLRFQVGELKDLAPQAGEEEKLAVARKRLANGERLRTAVAHAEESLYSGEQAAVELVGAVRDSLQAFTEVDDAVAPMARAVGEAQAIIEDVSRSLQKFMNRIQVDPEKLAHVEDRLEKLRRLSRKHGTTADGLVGKLAELEKELHGITNRDERGKALEKELGQARKRLGELAQDLAEKRRRAALKLVHATLEELGTLGMERASLQVAVEPLPQKGEGADLTVDVGEMTKRVGPRGLDRVEIRFSANPGEELKPLAKVVSGGELSRVLLALKRVLAQRDPVPVYVFDEVDAGVGGAVGESVGLKIKAVSALRQAMCVTHLPQIAAHADHHYVVEKVVQDGRTASRVTRLTADQRVEEVARMLGGLTITDATRTHARDMLRHARGAAA